MYTTRVLGLAAALLTSLAGCLSSSDPGDPPACTDGKCDGNGSGSTRTPGERLQAAVHACGTERDVAVHHAGDDADAVMVAQSEYAGCLAEANDKALPAVDAQYPASYDHDPTLLLDAVNDFRETNLCGLLLQGLSNSANAHMPALACQADAEALIAHDIGALALDTHEGHASFDATVGDPMYAACRQTLDAVTAAAGTQAQLAGAADGFANCVRDRIDELTPALGAALAETSGRTPAEEARDLGPRLDLNFGHVTEMCQRIQGPGIIGGYGVKSETGFCRARGYAQVAKALRDGLGVTAL